MTPCEMRGGKRKMGHWTILLEESCFQIWTVFFCRTLLQSELHGFFLCAVSLKSTWHKLTKWDLQWPTVFFFVLFCFVLSQQPANPPEIYTVDIRERRPVAGESSVSRLSWLLWLHACGAHLGFRRGWTGLVERWMMRNQLLLCCH